MENQDEKQKITLEISNDTPIIHVGNLGLLAFSKITSHPIKGYKYIFFYSKNTNNKNKARKLNNISISGIPKKIKEFIKECINPLLDKEGYISYQNIEVLKDKINNNNTENMFEENKRKRKYKKRKPKIV